MKPYSNIKDIEHKIRASIEYHFWVQQNKAHQCLNCDSTENLQVHHLIDLYHILLGLWKIYGNEKTVIEHAIAMHINDKCEAITLCKNCHNQAHPCRKLPHSNKDIKINEWIVIPRKLPAPLLHHPTVSKDHGLTLLGAQMLCAIGWYILNGQMESQIITCETNKLAKVLRKTSGTSFNKSIRRSLENLTHINIVEHYHVFKSHVIIQPKKSYLKRLTQNPWFMPLRDIHAKHMPVFAIRWFLNLQSKSKNYKIEKNKLTEKIGLKTNTPSFVKNCIENACAKTHWIKKCDFDGEYFHFKMRRYGATPIFSLRDILQDSITHGI